MTALSVIIVTRNRRRRLQATIDRLMAEMPLPPESWELHVVDNGSDDGTPRMVAELFPHVHLIAHERNCGACARTDAIESAAGRYLLFLDDDSVPTGSAACDLIEWMDAHPRFAIAYGGVDLPDGSEEASAYPAAPICCALCARREAMQAVGGFDRRFNRQAEELDLAFRLIGAGYAIARIPSARFLHDKPAGGRATAAVHELDVRNNLYIAHRYMPDPLRETYIRHWRTRYAALAANAEYPEAGPTGEVAAAAMIGEIPASAKPADARTINAILEVERQRRMMTAWSAEHTVRRLAIADFGKNLPATWMGCTEGNLDVLVILDSAPAFQGMHHEGIPVIADEDADRHTFDGIVLSNINPAQLRQRAEQLERRFQLPVLHFAHEPEHFGGTGGDGSGDVGAATQNWPSDVVFADRTTKAGL